MNHHFQNKIYGPNRIKVKAFIKTVRSISENQWAKAIPVWVLVQEPKNNKESHQTYFNALSHAHTVLAKNGRVEDWITAFMAAQRFEWCKETDYAKKAKEGIVRDALLAVVSQDIIDEDIFSALVLPLHEAGVVFS